MGGHSTHGGRHRGTGRRAAAEAREILGRLNRDAERIAARFALRYQSIEAERANVKSRYGICYADGRIKIRLRHATTGRPLRYSSLVSTLCHELAHLRHFDHGPRFRAFYQRVLEWARSEGIYRPGAGPRRPAQAGGLLEPALLRGPQPRLPAAGVAPAAIPSAASASTAAPAAGRSRPEQLRLF